MRDRLAELVSAAQTRYPDFGFYAPGGVLHVPGPFGVLDRMRVQLPTGEPLHLQSIGVGTVDHADVASVASVDTSSWYKQYGRRFSAQRLFDFANPTGTVVHTNRGDDPPWVEIRFARPLDVTSIALRNVDTYNTARARGIRISVAGPDGQWRPVYDAHARIEDLTAALDRMLDEHPPGADPFTRQLVPVVAKVLAGDYTAARVELDAMADLPDESINTFRAVISTQVLRQRRMRWTIHGPTRCFEYWSEAERVKYVRYAAEVAKDLSRLTPDVCFGFGAALCVVRDGDLIPHDDDLDVIIGFEPDQAATIPEARDLIADHLRSCGHQVRGTYAAHRKVSKPGNHPVDVFVGLFENEAISWYPGRRGALTRELMFPASAGPLLGSLVPLPRSPLLYLQEIYGPDWRTPDPGFAHVWGGSDYADLYTPAAER